MRYPIVILIPVLRIVNYYLVLLRTLLAEKKYSKHFVVENSEAVTERKWFSPDHLLVTTIISGFVILAVEDLPLPVYFSNGILGFILIPGVINFGIYLGLIITLLYVNSRSDSVTGKVKQSRNLRLLGGLGNSVCIIVLLLLAAVFTGSSFFYGGLISMALSTIKIVFIIFRKDDKKKQERSSVRKKKVIARTAPKWTGLKRVLGYSFGFSAVFVCFYYIRIIFTIAFIGIACDADQNVDLNFNVTSNFYDVCHDKGVEVVEYLNCRKWHKEMLLYSPNDKTYILNLKLLNLNPSGLQNMPSRSTVGISNVLYKSYHSFCTKKEPNYKFEYATDRAVKRKELKSLMVVGDILDEQFIENDLFKARILHLRHSHFGLHDDEKSNNAYFKFYFLDEVQRESEVVFLEYKTRNEFYILISYSENELKYNNKVIRIFLSNLY